MTNTNEPITITITVTKSQIGTIIEKLITNYCEDNRKEGQEVKEESEVKTETKQEIKEEWEAKEESEIKEETKILTYEEAKKAGLWYYSHDDGAYGYKTKYGYYHLIIGGKDVLEGKEAIECFYYGKGDYGYKDEDNYYHLIIGGKDVLEGRKAAWCDDYGGGVYEYMDEDGHDYHITQNVDGTFEYKNLVNNS